MLYIALKLKDMEKETLQHLAVAGVILLLSIIISLFMHKII